MKTAIIVSLNFNPGHVSHMVASYKQCEEIGYKSVLYIHPRFKEYLPEGIDFLCYGEDKLLTPSLAIILFPSLNNLKLIRTLKVGGTKVIYVFHEPLADFSEYKRSGFSIKALLKLWVVNRVSAWTVKKSDVIILPSRKALQYYRSNALYKNENYHYLPLMYDDECCESDLGRKREYFSYIGTIAADHSFNEYLRFILWAVKNNRLKDLNFLIATKSKFDLPEDLINNDRVLVQSGRPLSDKEINDFYSQSIVVWNAYARTTQSGVLAKSFMFGTPVIILEKNENEFASDSVEGKLISDNKDEIQIEVAIQEIISNFDSYKNNCRERFLSTFYYKNYNSDIEEILRKS